ncbi:MAG: amino acid ABC transporter permease [Zoogloeaceae bacterium]|jgi:L-cystine transport system permease protein|nr:amino acid ABC transporter permease [Zoogloeaceae bacterium]
MGQIFEAQYIFYALPRLLPYVPVTLLLLSACVLASILLGVVFALARIYPLPIITRMTAMLVSFTLGIPLLTLLFLFYFGLPEIMLLVNVDLTRTSGVYFVVLAFGLHYGAVLSEHIRGAVSSVGRGQFEAAFSIGLPFLTSLRRIVMPQAMRVLMPNVANTYLKAMKSTSIAFSAGVVDLMSQAVVIGSTTGHTFESYVAVAIIYYVMYTILSAMFNRIERHSLRYGI